MRIQKKAMITAAAAFVLTAAIQCLATFDVFGPLDKMTAGLLILAVCLAELLLVTRGKSFSCRCDEGVCLKLQKTDFAFFAAAFMLTAALTLKNIGEFGDAKAALLMTEKMQPYLYFRLAVTAAALLGAVLFVIAAFSDRGGFRSAALLCGAAFAFLVLVAESAYLMPLPNVALYLPRIFAYFCAACWFTDLCMATKSGLGKEAGRSFDYALLTCSYCLTDAAFWLFHSPSAYRPMAPYILAFDLAAAVCAAFMIATAGRHTAPAPIPTDTAPEEENEV